MEDYLQSEFLILIPVLNVLGALLKHTLGERAHRWIPAVLGGLGVLLVGLWQWVGGVTPLPTLLVTSLVQGLLAAGASVYVHQLLKQMTDTQ